MDFKTYFAAAKFDKDMPTGDSNKAWDDARNILIGQIVTRLIGYSKTVGADKDGVERKLVRRVAAMIAEMEV